MKKVIGLIGAAGAGKDTLYKEIEKRYDVKRFAQGDLMKESLNKAFEFLGLEPISEAAKEHYRPVMIAYAESLRAVEPNIWINKIIPDVWRCYDELPVITDIRNIDTIDAIEKAGLDMILFYVHRPGKDSEDIYKTLIDNHVEAYQITNNGTPEKMMAIFNHVIVENELDIWRKNETADTNDSNNS